jgi:ABC-type uncharacterized transport system permease subunit
VVPNPDAELLLEVLPVDGVANEVAAGFAVPLVAAGLTVFKIVGNV